jgi:hypothetical protein
MIAKGYSAFILVDNLFFKSFTLALRPEASPIFFA